MDYRLDSFLICGFYLGGWFRIRSSCIFICLWFMCIGFSFDWKYCYHPPYWYFFHVISFHWLVLSIFSFQHWWVVHPWGFFDGLYLFVYCLFPDSYIIQKGEDYFLVTIQNLMIMVILCIDCYCLVLVGVQ